jgi:hypothetical protein
MKERKPYNLKIWEQENQNFLRDEKLTFNYKMYSYNLGAAK